MTFFRIRTAHLLTGVAMAAAVALSLAVQAADAPLTRLNIAMVPVLDAAPFYYARSQGYYKDAGLDVGFSTNDAGAAAITGVINGTFDAAVTAWFPVAIAVSRGLKLKYVMSPNYVDRRPGHGDEAVITKPGSGINSYKDLEGKTVATNALTSLTVLGTKIVMKRTGADPDKVRFVALPFKSTVQAVAQGQADAAIVVTPFQTEAQEAGLKVFGDPAMEAFPLHAPIVTVVTSDATAQKKAAALAAFTAATFRAAKALNGNEPLQRELAQKVFGFPPAVAKKVPLPNFATGPMDLKALQGELDLAHEYGYLARPLKAADMVIGK